MHHFYTAGSGNGFEGGGCGGALQIRKERIWSLADAIHYIFARELLKLSLHVREVLDLHVQLFLQLVSTLSLHLVRHDAADKTLSCRLISMATHPEGAKTIVCYMCLAFFEIFGPSRDQI